MQLRTLAIRSLLVGLLLFGIVCAINHASLDPGIAGYDGMDETTFSYRVRTWFHEYGGIFAFAACWPAWVADMLGFSFDGPLRLLLGSIVAATGWLLLWHYASRGIGALRRAN